MQFSMRVSCHVQVFHPDASNKQRQDNDTSTVDDGDDDGDDGDYDDDDDYDPEALLGM